MSAVQPLNPSSEAWWRLRIMVHATSARRRRLAVLASAAGWVIGYVLIIGFTAYNPSYWIVSAIAFVLTSEGFFSTVIQLSAWAGNLGVAYVAAARDLIRTELRTKVPSSTLSTIGERIGRFEPCMENSYSGFLTRRGSDPRCTLSDMSRELAGLYHSLTTAPTGSGSPPFSQVSSPDSFSGPSEHGS